MGVGVGNFSESLDGRLGFRLPGPAASKSGPAGADPGPGPGSGGPLAQAASGRPTSGLTTQRLWLVLATLLARAWPPSPLPPPPHEVPSLGPLLRPGGQGDAGPREGRGGHLLRAHEGTLRLHDCVDLVVEVVICCSTIVVFCMPTVD